ncbi:MAG: SDR family oxidoreductase [Clostridia bacterium]|nr:SDR family oxidoreductase [Clostridia bacterium]
MGQCWIDNKTVIITGASAGIGKGVAEALIKKHNCKVIGIARSKEKTEKFVEELGDYAKNFSYKLFDVSSKENWFEFAEYLKENDIHPDVLINNAGILPKFNKTQNYSIEEIESVMNINFYSAVYSINALLPMLLESSTPAVINVASSAALMSLAGTSTYSASKGALKSFTESLREELRGKCYVTVICPGFTKTDIFRNQENTGKGEKMINAISTDCDRMVNMIVNGIENKKELMVFGFDAQFMKIFGRITPVTVGRLFSAVMKASKLPLFDNVFKD